ncbi:SRPBCC family protein [Tumebacillus lipolyticus]|uniref:SRPBCC domain-containing protein n=1 Tax=Tumebacillus lipolyticus TaxID=1280370 RepID=A0ABW4ZTJ6_9BACL
MIQRSMVLDLTANEAYMMLTQPTEMQRWLAHHVSRSENAMQLVWELAERTVLIDCQIVEETPGRSFSFRWAGAHLAGETQVSFTIHPEAGGSRVLLTERGFGAGHRWDLAIADLSERWDEALDTLAHLTGLAKTRQIVKETVVPFPADRVYRAFIDSEQLVTWFVREADVDMRQGGSYRLRDQFPTDGTGYVLELVPNKRIRLSWQWYMTSLPPTELSVELQSSSDETRVHVEHVGFGIGPEWDQEYHEHEEGWSRLLGLLWNHLYSYEASSL